MSKLFTPHPYQLDMGQHLIHNKRSALFAGMGLGKTVATLTNYELMDCAGEIDGPMLVVAPLRVAQSTWPDEAKKWKHLSKLEVSPIVGSVANRRKALAADANIFTTNYDNIPWLVEELNGKWPFATVVSDESTRLKGFRLRQGTQRAKALGRVAHSKVTRWHNLTGTPAPNGLQDLWGPTWFLDAGRRLGRSYDAFTQRWFRPKRSGYGVEPFEHSQNEIEERIGDICLSMQAKDYFDLNEPIFIPVYTRLNRRNRELYEDMEKEFFMQIEGHDIEAVNSAAKTQKLLQLASGAVYLDPDVEDDSNPRSKKWKEVHDDKIQALDSIIAEAAGMPVLVAYHFRSDLARLLKAFPHGRELDKNPKTIRDWNAGKIPILFAHPQSAGHGLNLQDGGNILVIFTPWWDLEQFLQILERIGPVRQLQAGYDRNVFVYTIICEDTMDEVVVERRDGKATIQDLLMSRLTRRLA